MSATPPTVLDRSFLNLANVIIVQLSTSHFQLLFGISDAMSGYFVNSTHPLILVNSSNF